LARHLDAPVEDVMRYAEADQLRKFFTRSDGGGMPGRDAYLQTLRKRWPNEPLTGAQPMTGRQAYLETLRKRHPTEHPTGYEPGAMLGAVAKVAIMAKRWPPANDDDYAVTQ
jgi:uncharacterized short protein YbdD (DUF466 family)